MDELIYQFLLQAGYPRASIVADPTILTSGALGDAPESASTFVIVDPETADRLAAIDVVDSVDDDTLQVVAGEVAHYARRLGGRDIQGFVIRIDTAAQNQEEQVQFYKVWPDASLQRLSAKSFPDLASLQVTRKLVLGSSAIAVQSDFVDVVDQVEVGENQVESIGFSRYLPALLLILLAGADWYLQRSQGVTLLTLGQTVLAVGAATLLTVTALRNVRR